MGLALLITPSGVGGQQPDASALDSAGVGPPPPRGLEFLVEGHDGPLRLDLGESVLDVRDATWEAGMIIFRYAWDASTRQIRPGVRAADLSEVRAVYRRRRDWWKGALLGAGVGAVAGVIYIALTDAPDANPALEIGGSAALLAGLGALTLDFGSWVTVFP
jgi:hypothetical protein